ncbi:hypothetical protein [Pseudomonas sp. S5D5]|uniref:hypothetical protein n=1 Tax=Pseudomonas sp. S5D5 TaxID=2083056 RepID=UPI000D0FA4DF|nr:hypothetical protein [Pseudomonas sp. S5D5]
MPLHLDDEFLSSLAYEEVAVALWAIRLHAADEAVTPTIALRLIRQYLQPLIPPEHCHLLYKQRVASWDGIWGIYASLGFAVCETRDHRLLEVMKAVQLIHANTTLPPREYTFPTVVEVTYFLSMCAQLQIPVQDRICMEDGYRLDPFSFCTLCWRQPLPGRKLCAHHAPNAPLQDEVGAQAAAARYKSGVRQKERFDKEVNRILTKEVTEFHEGLFTPAVLFPEQDIAIWLTERRPLLWQLLGEWQQELNDGNAVSMLLDLLHCSDGLPPKAYQIYRQINRHLQRHPHLIWPMLIRAEGWYRCREEVRGQWGGKRSGAGRPLQLAAEPPATSPDAGP